MFAIPHGVGKLMYSQGKLSAVINEYSIDRIN